MDIESEQQEGGPPQRGEPRLFTSVKRRGSMVLGVAIFGVIAAIFLLLPNRTVSILPEGPANVAEHPADEPTNTPEFTGAPEAPPPPATTTAPTTQYPNVTDLPPQQPLANPPAIVKGIYLTNWTAGSSKRLASLASLVDRTELNAMVIDIKDYSGYVAYRTGIPDVVASGAENELRILRPNALIKELHDKGIYVIGRISVFQDPILAKAHPEWAVKNKDTGKLWTDRKGLAWMDTAAEPVWDYHVALARDAFARGFDEVNFDYVRFPSDGDLSLTSFPFWDEKTAQHRVVAKFFVYLREQLPDRKLSADLFGLTTSAGDDLGIGQKIEDAYASFDYVSPMVYPSHFAAGYGGFQKPAEHPYEVIALSMTAGLAKLTAYVRSVTGVEVATSTATSTVDWEPAAVLRVGKLRPWLQVFDLGAVYDTAKIQAQIKAADDVLAGTEYYAGWLLWDPANNYRYYQ